jgi:S-adenosylmethionine:tRNA ribosyltransferase-isomerase
MAAASVMAASASRKYLQAAEPPEARSLRRDDVRLLVSQVDTDSVTHSRFNELPRWLTPGDLLVVNTSGTLNAALEATTAQGDRHELHVSTRLPGDFWVVEVRSPGPVASLPYRDAHAGMVLQLEQDSRAVLLAPYPLTGTVDARSRLWLAALELSRPVLPYLERFGSPIRYNYVTHPWPSSMYQTIFATEPGSAEMPSAARPFTPELITRLVSSGIQIAPLLLHTGVASLEAHEPPYEEYFRVTSDTADRVNAVRTAGHRVIAVGTTVVRALETVTDQRGMTFPGEGWTSLVITPKRPLRAVTGMITGFHEPHATHLAMIEQVIVAAGSYGRAASERVHGRVEGHLDRAYQEAQAAGYLWHEFGDSHLIIR